MSLREIPLPAKYWIAPDFTCLAIIRRSPRATAANTSLIMAPLLWLARITPVVLRFRLGEADGVGYKVHFINFALSHFTTFHNKMSLGSDAPLHNQWVPPLKTCFHRLPWIRPIKVTQSQIQWHFRTLHLTSYQYLVITYAQNYSFLIYTGLKHERPWTWPVMVKKGGSYDTFGLPIHYVLSVFWFTIRF